MKQTDPNRRIKKKDTNPKTNKHFKSPAQTATIPTQPPAILTQPPTKNKHHKPTPTAPASCNSTPHTSSNPVQTGKGNRIDTRPRPNTMSSITHRIVKSVRSLSCRPTTPSLSTSPSPSPNTPL